MPVNSQNRGVRSPANSNVSKDFPMKKVMLLTVAAGASVNVAAMAASPGNFTISPDGRTVAVPRALNVATSPAHRTKDTALFDNLATRDPKGVYTVGSGAGFGNVSENSPPVKMPRLSPLQPQPP